MNAESSTLHLGESPGAGGAVTTVTPQDGNIGSTEVSIKLNGNQALEPTVPNGCFALRLPIQKWIADAGSTIDAISKSDLTHLSRRKVRKLALPTVYETAGGDAAVDSAIPLYSKAIGGKVDANILESTPAVLTVGRRCMTPGPEGYAFHWFNCKPPYLERMSDGEKIHCVIENYIPYVYE